ncbi:MAG TPA: hypothetical protein VK901_20950, partial [Nitrospiraceae bacterium]|nr:hypothetical protein [Nitrospiraceae bacterium]
AAGQTTEEQFNKLSDDGNRAPRNREEAARMAAYLELEGWGSHGCPALASLCRHLGTIHVVRNDKGVLEFYEHISHATHFSPFGKTITRGHYLIGFPSDSNGYDYKRINRPISYGILGAHLIAMSLHHTVKSGAIEGVLDLSLDEFLLG